MAAGVEGMTNIAPRLNIQWDWLETLRGKEATAWVSCSEPCQQSIYGELHCPDPDELPAGSEGFVVEALDKRSLTLSFPEKRCVAKFINPTTVFPNLHRKSIRCLDISPGGALGVSAGTEGDLLLWNTNNGTVRHSLEGHVSDVTTCSFFPSGEVILSGSADMRLKIWSAEDGSCPATLVGHSGGISGTAIIERGRNIVSCSRDGTARLWDCGKSQCLAVVSTCDCPINACALSGVHGAGIGETPQQRSPGEVGTQGKLLVLGREDGVLEGVGLHSRQKVLQYKCSSAVNCCAFLPDGQVLCGTDEGQLYRFDVRCTSAPLSRLQRSRSAVLSLTPSGQRGLLVATADGSCSFLDVEQLKSACAKHESWELIGPDCDPVYKNFQFSDECELKHTEFASSGDHRAGELPAEVILRRNQSQCRHA